MPAIIEREDIAAAVDGLLAELNGALAKVMDYAGEGLPAHDRELVIAEGIRNMTRVMANGQLNCMEDDPRYPFLVKTISLQRRLVQPGADTVYHSAILHGDYEYRLRGNRGTAHIFELEVWRGHHSDLANFKFHSTLDRFTAGPGEDIDIRLSRTGGGADWIELPEGECTILVRQYYYDWATENPAVLSIARDGAVYPPPPLDIAGVTAQFKRMINMIRTYPAAARHGVSQHLSAPMNSMHLAPINIGFRKLQYMHGQFLCRPDEAVIITVKPPAARYWNFQLLDLQWAALDYAMRQCSINGHEAKLDGDGVFRAVISQCDPGYVNWLDSSGRSFGLVSARYYEPDAAPVPTLQIVPFDSLKQHLPADMAMISAGERQLSIAHRIASAARRLTAD